MANIARTALGFPVVVVAIGVALSGCVRASGCDAALEVCTQPSQSSASLGQEFELRPSGVATIDGTALRITFERVSEDSRCPVDVTCVWQGNAAVQLIVTDDGAEVWRGVLNSGMAPRAIVVKTYELTLIGVTPGTRANARIEPRDYRAKLKLAVR